MGADSAEGLDRESLAWLRRLAAGGGDRQAAELELHARLVRIALAAVRRPAASTPANGQELDGVSHQAADDAMLAILAKLGDFRGESRFVTWAYRFVILEVSAKAGRHWRNPPAPLDAGQRDRGPGGPGTGPQRRADCDEAMAVLHIYTDLTAANGDPAARYPAVAAHLATCGPCAGDLAGLLAAISG